MTKKKVYVCNECGYESIKWIGKCPDCGEWDSFKEVIQSKKASIAKKSVSSVSMDEIEFIEINQRLKTGISEFDRVLGGGVVNGSLTLFGGEPGIGKSTLLLQAASKINGKVLYISGEESGFQIKLRAERLGIDSKNIFILTETDIENIKSVSLQEKPILLIVDSIQTVYSDSSETLPGSIGQLRSATYEFLQFSKESGISVFLIGHVTKDGAIAGPKLMEHIVDCVIYFEEDSKGMFRILRSKKNRFGSTNETGIFEMHRDGLKEVKDPTRIFVDNNQQVFPGTAVSVIYDGNRPVLIEVQALVSYSNFSMPRRIVEGIDYNKAVMITALLEKISKLNLRNQDVYLKITGGFKISDPAVDMAIAAAIISSYKNIGIEQSIAFIGELGLSGIVRNVSNLPERLNAAERIGLQNIIIPHNANQNFRNKKISIKSIKRVTELAGMVH